MASHGTLALLLSLAVASTVSAQGGYGKGHDGYFTYVNVPGRKGHEFGWNRGNKHDSISRYEQAKDHRSRSQVKWQHSKGGHGEKSWEYNHGMGVLPENGYGKGHDAGYGGGHDTGYGKGHAARYGKRHGSGFARKDDAGYFAPVYSPSYSLSSYSPSPYTPPVYTPQRSS